MAERSYPHSTGEFQIPGLKSDCKMATCIYNDELHVVGGHPKWADDYRAHYLAHQKFPLNLLREKKKTDWKDAPIKDPSNWESVKFQDNAYASSPYDYNGKLTKSDNTSLVNAGDALWLFRVWSDGGNLQLIANKYQAAPDTGSSDDDSPESSWGKDIVLFEPLAHLVHGPMVSNMGAVHARAFGDNQILVTICSTDANGQNSRSIGKIVLFLFDASEVKTDKKTGKMAWFAQSCWEIDLASQAKFMIGNKPQSTGLLVSGIRVETEWLYTLKPDPSHANKGVPQYYLAVAISPSIPWNESYTYTAYIGLKLDPEFENVDILAKDPWEKGPLTFYNQGNGLEFSIKRDPSGRLQRLSRFQDNKFNALYTSTVAPPPLEPGFGNQPGATPTYNVSEGKTYPSNLFYPFAAGKKTTKTVGKTVSGSSVEFGGKPQQGGHGATEYPVLEFLFYGTNKCQLHDYGKIVVAQDTKYLKQKGEVKKVIIGGYVDSAIPFPVQNFIGQPLSGNEFEVGNFTYMTTKEAEKEMGLETDWSVGVEAEFKTTKGIGPNMNLKVEGGMGTEDKTTYSSSIERGIPVAGTVKSYGDSQNPYAEGAGMVNALRAQLTLIGYQFYDAAGKIVNDALSGDDALSLKMGAILTRMIAADTTELAFEPFMVEPGDLASYTPEAINAKMKKLGYKGDDYFEDVIAPNSMPISGLPYLPFTWTHGSGSTIKTLDVNSDFTEQSWKLDTSLYLGVGGGEEISFFGMGEGFEFSAMFGGSYSRKRSTGELKSSGWGVELGEGWGPIVPDKDNLPKDAVRNYSFRMYYLPVPKEDSGLPKTYWTDELLKYLGDDEENDITTEMIDTGSGCWRICFVVDNIQCYDAESELNYDIKDNFPTR